MTLHQTHKAFTISNIDKENNFLYQNNASRKANFVIKKCPKVQNLKPIIRNVIQPTLEHVDASMFPGSKSKNSGAIRKVNATFKSKKPSLLEKDTYNIRKESIEIILHKDKQIMTMKNRAPLALKENNHISLPGIATRNSVFSHSLKGDYYIVGQRKRKSSFDMVQNFQKQEEELMKKKPISSEVFDSKMRITEESLNFSEEPNNVMKEYADEVLQTLKEKDEELRPTASLFNHLISESLRTKMVDWMVEVMHSYKCSDQTFFMAVDLMDTFLTKTHKYHTANDLHLLGVVVIFMAAKFEEIYPMKLSVLQEKIAHGKLSIQEITEKEGEILQKLNFNITSATLYEIMTNVLFQLNLKEQLNDSLFEYLEKVCVYLAKSIMYDYELVSNYNYSYLAASTLFVAFKVVEQLEPSFSLLKIMKKVSVILRTEQDQLYNCANQVLALMKNFDKIYPNFQNLKKFYFLGLPESSNL